MAEWTYGAPGEIDDDGIIRKISVVPKPFQQAASAAPVHVPADDSLHWPRTVAVHMLSIRIRRLYREVASQAGRSLRWAVGAFRAVHLGRTEDAVELLRATHHRRGFITSEFAGLREAWTERLPP